MEKEGSIIVISGPSGSGKTTIVKAILDEFPELLFSVSATTRNKRTNEKNGVDYFFLTYEEFEEKIKNNEFIEWEKFYNYYYGTPKNFINENIKKHRSVLLEVDVKGALSVKKAYKDANLVYVVPPSYEELAKRLKERRTENDNDLQKRLERAKMELSIMDKFDYFISNDNLKKAILDAKNLVKKILIRSN